jgi:hypothetical protein
MLDNNIKAIESYFGDKPELHAVMTHLLELHGLSEIVENAGDLLGVLSQPSLELAEAEVVRRLEVLRPNAVALVDSFGFLDSQLKSTLGRKDGRVYQAIYSEAKQNPLNGPGAMVGWDQLSTVLDLNFLDETAKRQRVLPTAAKL